MTEYSNNVKQIINEINKAVIGKDYIIARVLAVILAKGHVLIEDIPGVGKTTLALAFSKVMELEQNRLQFTPDVLPTDIVGFNLISKDNHNYEYKPGPIMCNLFLADEINRTSPKTQSALLEVMEEGNVTVDGITREVPKPFTVIATQNPLGSIGTQVLPESQLDRFMIKLTMGYPDVQSEINILKGKQKNNPIDLLNKTVTREELISMQETVEQVFIHDSIYEYIANLVQQTRKHPMLELGVSPRGTIALTNMAKANAYLYGRSYMIPDDVKMTFHHVTAHRIILKPKAKVNNITAEGVIDSIFQLVQTPRVV